MNRLDCAKQMNNCLRQALKEYHASSGINQEKLAEKLFITPKACSSLENGKHGFSAFTAFALLALLPDDKRLPLVTQICDIFLSAFKSAA